MPAPTANRNAEKWTLKATLDKLDEMEYYVQDDRIYTLRTALCKVRLYTGVWSYWKEIWADNEDVMEYIYWVEEVFMAKLQEGALSKRLNASMAIFLLKVNYGMHDKPIKKDEQIPEEKLPHHLQAELDRIQTAKKAAAKPQPDTIIEEPQTETLPQTTISVPTISYTEAQCPEPQRAKDYQPEPESWLSVPLKAAA